MRSPSSRAHHGPEDVRPRSSDALSRSARQEFPEWYMLRGISCIRHGLRCRIEMLSSHAGTEQAHWRTIRVLLICWASHWLNHNAAWVVECGLSHHFAIGCSMLNGRYRDDIFNNTMPNSTFRQPPCPASCYEQDECGGGAGVEQPRRRNGL